MLFILRPSILKQVYFMMLIVPGMPFIPKNI